MGDGEYRAVFEFGFDDFLYELIVFEVDVGGGFIDDDNFAVFEEGSADAE